mgnify:CR=1 FL=1
MLKETVEKFKEIYKTKKDTIDWMEKHGTEFEQMQARIIKNVALNN